MISTNENRKKNNKPVRNINHLTLNNSNNNSDNRDKHLKELYSDEKDTSPVHSIIILLELDQVNFWQSNSKWCKTMEFIKSNYHCN